MHGAHLRRSKPRPWPVALAGAAVLVATTAGCDTVRVDNAAGGEVGLLVDVIVKRRLRGWPSRLGETVSESTVATASTDCWAVPAPTH